MSDQPTMESAVDIDLDAMIGDAGTVRLNGRVLAVRNIDAAAFRAVKGITKENSDEVMRRVLKRLIPAITDDDLDGLMPHQVQAILDLSMRTVRQVDAAIDEGNGDAPAPAQATPAQTSTAGSEANRLVA